MPWTQSDADQVREAILKLVTGKRVVTVNYAGPPARSVSYQLAELGDLRAILAEMERSAGGGATYRLASTRSGL